MNKLSVALIATAALAFLSCVDTKSNENGVEQWRAKYDADYKQNTDDGRIRWVVKSHVDEFGEPTSSRYATNDKVIRGTFSNTATQDSELNVLFIIDHSEDIAVQLFEYAGNNPVKAYSRMKYRLLIKDSDGKVHRLEAYGWEDTVAFNRETSKQVFNSLSKDGEVKFKLVEKEQPINYYEFSVSSTNKLNALFK